MADATGSAPDESPEALRALQDFLTGGDTSPDALDRFCADIPHLAREVRRLFRRWQEMDALVGSSLFGDDVQGAALSQVLTDEPGDADAVDGEDADPESTLAELSAHGGDAERYRLDRRDAPLGQGGMGTIHRAWDKNLRRWVVRKVLDRGPGSHADATDARTVQRERRALSRFLDEALVTGQLDHPGIVPVHELGVTEHGQAFFTMKMVEGQDLRHILDRLAAGSSDWSVNRVVGVLRRVSEAVAYAHSKGVLHRDIKPANIMVGRFGEAYLMDWGLARIGEEHRPAMDRATSASVLDEPMQRSDACLYTYDGEVLGTPVYMSPEQAHGDVAEIDERSDVYSLGAILYQALTARLPFVEGDERPPPFEVLMRVRRGPPRRLRELSPDAPDGLVEICERAMARDPGARYQTAEALAAALGDYLEDISEDREEARRQARRAELINEFLMDALGSADPAVARGRDVTVREVVERAASRIERSDRVLEPVDLATLHGTIGTLFARMGSNERAEPHLVKARELLRELSGESDARYLDLASELATPWRRMRRFEEAETMLRETLAVQTARFGVDARATLKTMDGLAMVLEAMGRMREAQALHADVLVARRSVLGNRAQETLVTLNNLGKVMQMQGLLDEAEPLLRDAAEGLADTLGEDHPLALTSLGNLGIALLRAERFEEAAEIHRRALRIKRAVLGSDHPETVSAMNNLANNLTSMGAFEEAEATFREGLAIQERFERSQHLGTLSMSSNLGLLLVESGRSEEAEPLFRSAVDGAVEVLGEGHRITARFRHHLGRLHLVLGRLEDAERELASSFAVLERERDGNADWLAESASALSDLHDRAGRSEEADRFRRRADAAAREA